MKTNDSQPAEHPWYLDLRPRGGGMTSGTDAGVALRALDAIGAAILAVHVDTLPTLADVAHGHGYVGWTILVPGSVDLRTIEAIADMAGGGYRAVIAPGHPLPPTTEEPAAPTTRRGLDRICLPSPPVSMSGASAGTVGAPAAGGA